MGKSRLKAWVVIISGLALLAGCRQIKRLVSHHHGTNDAAITSQIDAKLYQDPVLKTREIHVSAQQGVVTLTGAVDKDSERTTAESLASGVSGVKQVIDELTASASNPVPPPAVSRETTSASVGKPAASGEKLAEQKAVVPKAKATGNGTKPSANTIAQTNVQQNNKLPQVIEEPPAPNTSQGQTQTVTNPPPPAPPPQPVSLTVPMGTDISIRMIDSIDSATNKAGQTFAASLTSPVVVGNQVVIPQGADARVKLEEDQSAGHFKGRSFLKVELVSITANGTTYNVETDAVEKKGASRGKNSAEKIGGAGGIGALIGGILGGGKGAGIGAAIGAAGGAVDQGLTHGKQVKIPSETRLDFSLRGPLTIELPPSSASSNPQ